MRSKVLRDSISGMTKPEIRRLARRGGVKRIKCDIYNQARLAMRIFLHRLILKACALAELAGRKTISTVDVGAILAKSVGRD